MNLILTTNTIKEFILDSIPKSLTTNTAVLANIDVLFIDNDYGMFDEEELLPMLADVFVMGANALDITYITNKNYGHACKYNCYRKLGINEVIAYSSVFPKRAEATAVAYQGADYGRIMLRKARLFNKLDVMIKLDDVCRTDIHVSNSHLLQSAIDKLEYLMANGLSEKVQLEASVALLKELKPPESLVVKHDVTVDIDTESILDKFKSASKVFATDSVKAITSGENHITDVEVIFRKEVACNDN